MEPMERAEITWGDGETYHFVTVGGDRWLEVNGPTTLEDRERIATLIAGNGRTRPILATRGYLRMQPEWDSSRSVQFFPVV